MRGEIFFCFVVGVGGRKEETELFGIGTEKKRKTPPPSTFTLRSVRETNQRDGSLRHNGAAEGMKNARLPTKDRRDSRVVVLEG